MALCSFDGFSVVPSWCPGGLGGGLVVSQRFPYKLQGVCGVLVVSWWRRVGGVEVVVLVVGWLCLSAASLRVIQIFSVVSWLVTPCTR